MKKVLSKFLLLFFSVITIGCAKKEPNIIFIIADDMYPYMFNSISDTVNLTPNMDKLVAEGVWLNQMKVVSPVCTPSRYNSLTGNYASRATNRATLNTAQRNAGQRVIQWNSFIVPGQEKTMGTYFQNLGYRTGFVGKNHIIESTAQVGEEAKPELNADIKDSIVKAGLSYRYQELQYDVCNSGFDYADGLYHNNPNFLGVKQLASHNMDWITKKGIDFIETYKEQPFLLYFATTLPHGPHAENQSWKADRRITPLGRIKKSPNVLPKFEGELDEASKIIVSKYPGLEPTVRNYLSIEQRVKTQNAEGKLKENLLWLDDAIGALVKKLEDTELLDDTIIVFFNDHGQELKGTLYEGGINSQAFIWKKGGFKVGKVLNVPVSNVDFLPTLLDLAGGSTKSEDFDGYSFKKALENKAYNAREATYHELGYARAVSKDDFKYYAVRYPKWAMDLSIGERQAMLDKQNEYKRQFGRPLLTADPMAPFGQLVMIPGGDVLEQSAYKAMPCYSDPDQFYDLKNDPFEQHNLIYDPQYQEKIAELKEELKNQLDKLPGNYAL